MAKTPKSDFDSSRASRAVTAMLAKRMVRLASTDHAPRPAAPSWAQGHAGLVRRPAPEGAAEQPRGHADPTDCRPVGVRPARTAVAQAALDDLRLLRRR